MRTIANLPNFIQAPAKVPPPWIACSSGAYLFLVVHLCREQGIVTGMSAISVLKSSRLYRRRQVPETCNRPCGPSLLELGKSSAAPIRRSEVFLGF